MQNNDLIKDNIYHAFKIKIYHLEMLQLQKDWLIKNIELNLDYLTFKSVIYGLVHFLGVDYLNQDNMTKMNFKEDESFKPIIIEITFKLEKLLEELDDKSLCDFKLYQHFEINSTQRNLKIVQKNTFQQYKKIIKVNLEDDLDKFVQDLETKTKEIFEMIHANNVQNKH